MTKRRTKEIKKGANRQSTIERQRKPRPLKGPSKSAMAWWTPFRLTVAFVVSLVAFVSALFPFLPRISIDLAPSSDPANALAIVATIQNTGFIPLEDVQIMLGVCEISFRATSREKESTSDCEGPLQAAFVMKDWYIPNFVMDQKFGLTLGQLFNMKPPAKLYNGDISVIVTYRPKFWPFRSRKEYGIKSIMTNDSVMTWLFVPR